MEVFARKVEERHAMLTRYVSWPHQSGGRDAPTMFLKVSRGSSPLEVGVAFAEGLAHTTLSVRGSTLSQ